MHNKSSSLNHRCGKGYWIRMPTEPELGITAPCKLWCTWVALFISCTKKKNKTQIETKETKKHQNKRKSWKEN